ncbi:MAG: hypothetical protein BMS9Abin13_529 [Patescibacteria group bacterium]|nr:MAG: hypothetical protein BMS9Abin13_529 [Patescibacteria group bacterium]
MPKAKLFLKIFLLVLVVATIGGYSYYRVKDFVIGPSITISSPQAGATLSYSLVEVSGTAKNISYLSLDGRQIFTDEEGVFREKLLLYPGYNIISMRASDRFERETEEIIEVVYKENRVDNENEEELSN